MKKISILIISLLISIATMASLHVRLTIAWDDSDNMDNARPNELALSFSKILSGGAEEDLPSLACVATAEKGWKVLLKNLDEGKYRVSCESAYYDFVEPVFTIVSFGEGEGSGLVLSHTVTLRRNSVPASVSSPVVDMENDDAPWYDMHGYLLPYKPASQGIFIHQGKKIVVK